MKFLLLLAWAIVGCVCVCQAKFCWPGEPCWPCYKGINEFNSSLDGELVQVWDEDYNRANYVKNWDYITRPGLIVRAKNLEDVQKSILFAKKHGIQLSFLSSGHDYIGRNTGLGTLMVRMDGMKQHWIYPDDAQSPTGASMVAETGNSWGRIYESIDKYRLMAVGGASHGVSMGGWFLGGGHSPISRKYGLGVDNILSFRGVLPNGRICNISASGISYDDGETSTDTDLWWALRGGGGSTYAIIAQFHFQLHKQPPNFVQLGSEVPWRRDDLGVNNSGAAVLDLWHKHFLTLNENWGGYCMVNNRKDDLGRLGQKYGSVTFWLLFMGSWEDAMRDFAPLASFHPEWFLWRTATNFSSFWNYSKNNVDDLNFPTYIVNRLIQPMDLWAEGNDTTPLTNALATYYNRYEDMPPDKTVSCSYSHIGKKTSEPASNVTSIHPSFRTAMVSLSCGSVWSPGNNLMKAIIKANVKEFSESLYTVGQGMYVNEPDGEIEDWKQQYWGSNYDRLLQIKKKYDPANLFKCRNCVAYDLQFTGDKYVPTEPTEPTPRAAAPIERVYSTFVLLIAFSFSSLCM